MNASSILFIVFQDYIPHSDNFFYHRIWFLIILRMGVLDSMIWEFYDMGRRERESEEICSLYYQQDRHS